MTADRYMVVSADCHAGGAIQDYRPYLESRWHEDFDAWAADFHDGWADQDDGEQKFGAASVAVESNWDSERRLRELEADGVVGEVLFPNTAPPFFPSGALSSPAPRTREEYERRWAGLKAHNRWLVDFCAVARGRRAGVAQILLNDVDDAVREIEWVRAAGLTGGILLPAVLPDSGLPPLHNRVYDPIFAACADLGVPVNHHASLAGQPDEKDAAGWAVTLTEVPFFGTRGLWHLIYGGVFERYPALRFVMTELFIGWVPERLALLDGFYWQGKSAGTVVEKLCQSAFKDLPRPPSEYFRRNCAMGASFMLPAEAPLRYDLGIERIMWGSDYPHSEGSYPYSREALRITFADVPVEECRQILGENAVTLYGLDRDVLRRAADEFGPTVEEVHRPLTPAETPAFPAESACMAFAAPWA